MCKLGISTSIKEMNLTKLAEKEPGFP